MSDYSKYNVPPFTYVPEPTRYIWWSWHPLYPRWSQSCWGGDTVEEAMRFLDSPVHGLDIYHNKLISHSESGLEEVLDVPCKETQKWDKCLEII
jgi:hypothetical protein